MTIVGIARVPGITSIDRETTRPIAPRPASPAAGAYSLGLGLGRTLPPANSAANLARVERNRADHTDPVILRFLDGIAGGVLAERVDELVGAITEPCPSWCVAQGLHLADEHPDDRAHYSEGREVFRSLEAATDGRPKPAAWACLVHFADEPQARVNAFLGADHAVDLTPAEAREYAAALIALADLAEQTAGRR